jgi:hypothetical protein
MPASLKRDVKTLAMAERRPISQFCAGMIRLGIGRYFELADARRAAPLAQKMRDLFTEGDPYPPTEQRANYLQPKLRKAQREAAF